MSSVTRLFGFKRETGAKFRRSLLAGNLVVSDVFHDHH